MPEPPTIWVPMPEPEHETRGPEWKRHRDRYGRIDLSALTREQRAEIDIPAAKAGRAFGYLLGWGLTIAALIGLTDWMWHLISAAHW